MDFTGTWSQTKVLDNLKIMQVNKDLLKTAQDVGPPAQNLKLYLLL